MNMKDYLLYLLVSVVVLAVIAIASTFVLGPNNLVEKESMEIIDEVVTGDRDTDT